MFYSYNLLRRVKRHLKSGKIIAYPAESCYGFGCNIFNYQAINKVCQLKKRNNSKGFITIAERSEQLNTFVTQNGINAFQKYNADQQQTTTYILEAKKKIGINLKGKNNSGIAVRIIKKKAPSNSLLKFLHAPLLSTSSNTSGRLPIKNYKECLRLFGNNDKNLLILPGMIGTDKKQSRIFDTIKGIFLR